MIAKRLKEARLNAKLTQEKLGVLAGLEEASSSSRLSHYENGTHKPTFELTCAFAKILDVPECYFYIIDDAFAEKVLKLYRDADNKNHYDYNMT
ncbi:helix-turn-helix domain-containing protein [Pantoea cypripedii]|uniref:Transcriptional regulator n=1 Tax=Pantoea cypripedii TaxID=55209 RepID=A0A1X1EN92_PANCY|nr:helix-turn-helix transcriptional regulator [Pantoea cypripedii]MBP2199111.1 transcriptional regulator with XRE-family HTH domain [Pantoea cypripedii]ORM90234.1 transcriptional regulator [Pantoea cypripedii]